jgi:hypothetical protein
VGETGKSMKAVELASPQEGWLAKNPVTLIDIQNV